MSGWHDIDLGPTNKHRWINCFGARSAKTKKTCDGYVYLLAPERMQKKHQTNLLLMSLGFFMCRIIGRKVSSLLFYALREMFPDFRRLLLEANCLADDRPYLFIYKKHKCS